MSRLTISQARPLWRDAITEKQWQGRVIEKVMFDWPFGKPTRYHHNPPAFYSIADERETVDEESYRELQAQIIRGGEQFSNLGRARISGNSSLTPLCVSPAPVAFEEIQQP